MFVRRLVSGVRSSWEASCTSCRWRCWASSSEPSIALNVAASVPSSSLESTAIRWLRSRVARTRSAVSLRSRSGRSVARATRKPATPAIRRRPSRPGRARAGSARARGRRRRAAATTWIATGGQRSRRARVARACPRPGAARRRRTRRDLPSATARTRSVTGSRGFGETKPVREVDLPVGADELEVAAEERRRDVERVDVRRVGAERREPRDAARSASPRLRGSGRPGRAAPSGRGSRRRPRRARSPPRRRPRTRARASPGCSSTSSRGARTPRRGRCGSGAACRRPPSSCAGS